jgi:hypothetical protein
MGHNLKPTDRVAPRVFLRRFSVNTVWPFQMMRACRNLLEAAERASVLMTSSIVGITGGGLRYGR